MMPSWNNTVGKNAKSKDAASFLIPSYRISMRLGSVIIAIQVESLRQS